MNQQKNPERQIIEIGVAFPMWMIMQWKFLVVSKKGADPNPCVDRAWQIPRHHRIFPMTLTISHSLPSLEKISRLDKKTMIQMFPKRIEQEQEKELNPPPGPESQLRESAVFGDFETVYNLNGNNL